MADVLAVGAGYSVLPALRVWAAKGLSVLGTTRSEEKVSALRAAGITPLPWSGPEPLMASAPLVVVSVAPGEDGCPVLRALPPGALSGARVLYLSSSGVYGDYGGAWIDEDAPCRPSTSRGRRRLKAEAAWRARAEAEGARLTLCRLSGIYGPGRSAVDSLRGGTRGAQAGLAQRVVKPGQVFNRIHRDDIACGLLALALAEAEECPVVLNFADDEPAPPQDVIEHAARLLGIDAPPELPFEAATLSPIARSFYAENKRLRNDRLKTLIGPLCYPTYREGLASIAASASSFS